MILNELVAKLWHAIYNVQVALPVLWRMAKPGCQVKPLRCFKQLIFP